MSGTVKDAKGAVITCAHLTLTETTRNLVRTRETDGNGNFAFTALTPGAYELKAEQAGFKTYIQSGIQLEVDQSARVEISLQVGAVSETVTVVGETPLVRTQDINFGGVVENRRIMEMPLNGRFSSIWPTSSPARSVLLIRVLSWLVAVPQAHSPSTRRAAGRIK